MLRVEGDILPAPPAPHHLGHAYILNLIFLDVENLSIAGSLKIIDPTSCPI